MNLVDTYTVDTALYVLFDLLTERTPDQSISHGEMPSLGEHTAFFNSKPYSHWYLIQEGEEWVGSIYLTKQREVGLFIFKADKGKGYGKKALDMLLTLHGLPLCANINPNNEDSIGFFTNRGFKHIQNTYVLTET